jgi:hypothetical protein
MAALQFVIKIIESETESDVSPIIEELKILDKELEDYLQQN